MARSLCRAGELFLNDGARARFAEAHTLVEVARSRVVEDAVRQTIT